MGLPGTRSNNKPGNAGGVEAEIGKLVTERTNRLENINSDEAGLRSLRDRLSELQEKRGTHSVRQTQLQLQIEHLAEHVMERYRLDLRAFQPDEPAHEKVLHAQFKRFAKDSVAAVVSRGPDEETPPAEPATTPDVENLVADLTRQLENMGPVNLEAVQNTTNWKSVIVFSKRRTTT